MKVALYPSIFLIHTVIDTFIGATKYAETCIIILRHYKKADAGYCNTTLNDKYIMQYK